VLNTINTYIPDIIQKPVIVSPTIRSARILNTILR